MVRINTYTPESSPHPGEILAEKLEETGMGMKEFALRTGKPEQTINKILKGRSSITPDMAVQFESVTGIPAHFWMNSQKAYDEYLAREKYQAVLDEAADWARHFPTSAMAKMGWIEPAGNIREKAAKLFRFFAISDHHAWRNYFINGELKVAFRISLAGTRDPYAISAWLRKGELLAAATEANPYSETKFRQALPVLKNLMAEQPEDFFPRLQAVCRDAGVKVIFTPCLPKAPVNGATRWIGDHPVIQLSGRYKRSDIFWFTFFHEAGHILLHGKKDIFLEDVEYDEKDSKKESEADAFAVEWTLSKAQEAEVIASGDFRSQRFRE
ncbi:MAG: HigA family addiction module antidote protein [Candidatus Cyclonatronum sp.]|uniref:HigA family addiction module antitoxin n=1 Tax=Cyclonatronum sp. TaxID=3024185 RepID=UPI0025B988B9|nr:HigA family addiction module antitoxin [Cyclonatronum sp.]MCH8487930.1 HigA family addiction module antidote protein [Cyclonatronum sp.]